MNASHAAPRVLGSRLRRPHVAQQVKRGETWQWSFIQPILRFWCPFSDIRVWSGHKYQHLHHLRCITRFLVEQSVIQPSNTCVAASIVMCETNKEAFYQHSALMYMNWGHQNPALRFVDFGNDSSTRLKLCMEQCQKELVSMICASNGPLALPTSSEKSSWVNWDVYRFIKEGKGAISTCLDLTSTNELPFKKWSVLHGEILGRKGITQRPYFLSLTSLLHLRPYEQSISNFIQVADVV